MIYFLTFLVGLGFLGNEDCKTTETPETSELCLILNRCLLACINDKLFFIICFRLGVKAVTGLNHVFLYISATLSCCLLYRVQQPVHEKVFLKVDI